MIRNFFILFTIITSVAGCKDDYDTKKYSEIKENAELEDVVHEWMRDYIEKYCRVQTGGRIECE